MGVALSYLLWAVSYNFLLFLLARVLCGICKGNVSISTSIVTDVTSHEGRNKGMVRGGEGEGEGRGGVGQCTARGYGCRRRPCLSSPCLTQFTFPHLCTHNFSQTCSCPTLHLPPQALVGVSFSLGFIFGPTIGALFSILGHSSYVDSLHAFQLPALFAFLMATADIVIIAALFRETLPAEQRVRTHTSTHTCA